MAAIQCAPILADKADTIVFEERVNALRASLPNRIQVRDEIVARTNCWVQDLPDDGAPSGIYHPLKGTLLGVTLGQSSLEILQTGELIKSSTLLPDSFLLRRRFRERLALIHRLGGRLIIDPSLVGAAYFSSPDDSIVLNPSSSSGTFEHEFAHLVHAYLEKNPREPELQAEFGELFEFVNALRRDTRFSDSTLKEVFAVLHETRFESGAKRIKPPAGTETYLFTYIKSDLENIAEPNLRELQWKRLLDQAPLVKRRRFMKQVAERLAWAMVPPSLYMGYELTPLSSYRDPHFLGGHWQNAVPLLVNQILRDLGHQTISISKVHAPLRHAFQDRPKAAQIEYEGAEGKGWLYVEADRIFEGILKYQLKLVREHSTPVFRFESRNLNVEVRSDTKLTPGADSITWAVGQSP